MSLDETPSQSPSEAPGPRARVLQALRRASALGVLHSQAVARRAGLSSTDMEALDLLMMGGPATAGQIGARTGLTSGAVTGLVDRLERQGWVRRTADPQDRRKVRVEAVPEKLAPLEALFRPMAEGMATLLARHDPDFLDRVADLLEEAEALALARVEALNRA